MAQLYKHLRIHPVFGANTDVGKTLLTTALIRASATKGNQVFYLKPVSTGPAEEADDELVFLPFSESRAKFVFDLGLSKDFPINMVLESKPNAFIALENL